MLLSIRTNNNLQLFRIRILGSKKMLVVSTIRFQPPCTTNEIEMQVRLVSHPELSPALSPATIKIIIPSSRPRAIQWTHLNLNNRSQRPVILVRQRHFKKGQTSGIQNFWKIPIMSNESGKALAKASSSRLSIKIHRTSLLPSLPQSILNKLKSVRSRPLNSAARFNSNRTLAALLKLATVRKWILVAHRVPTPAAWERITRRKETEK